jgi:diguanylate cyclase (GGDEF)-like protein
MIMLKDNFQITEVELCDALNCMEEAFVIYDADGLLVFCNEAFRNLYGYTIEQTRPGVHFRELGEIDIAYGNVAIEDEKGADYLDRKAAYRKELSGSFTVKLQDGRWIRTTDRRTSSGGIVSVQSDVTELKEIEQLRYMANHDALTGLPTRRLAKEKTEDAIFLAERHSWKVAFIYIDLDDFKAVNDALGHDAGDELLKQVSQRFSKCLRKTDTLARIGGDEFLVLLTEVTTASDVRKVCENLISETSRPFTIDGQTCSIGASIGIALYPEHGSNSSTVLKRADSAMYTAKQAGKNRMAMA